jgi:hypothetical protein
MDDILVLNKLRFGQEIRDTKEIEPPKTTIKPG